MTFLGFPHSAGYCEQWAYRGSRCGSGCETFVDSAFRSGFIVAWGFDTTAAVDDWLAELDADFPANDAQDIGFCAGTSQFHNKP